MNFAAIVLAIALAFEDAVLVLALLPKCCWFKYKLGLGGVEAIGRDSGSASESVSVELQESFRSVPSRVGGACSELKELSLPRRPPAALL